MRQESKVDRHIEELCEKEASSGSRLAAILHGWEGRPVSVRLVVEPGELVAVFAGMLGARPAEAHPPWFWPVESDATGYPTVEHTTASTGTRSS